MAIQKKPFVIEIRSEDGTIDRTHYRYETMEQAARYASYSPVPSYELHSLSSPAQFVNEVITAYLGLLTGNWTVVQGMGNQMTIRIAEDR